MTRSVSRSRSLEEIEGDRWPAPPSNSTRLIATAHALRRKPVGKLTPEDLRLLIRQNIGPPHLLPIAVELLRADPMVAGSCYEGDLLAAVLTRARTVWTAAPRSTRDLRVILTEPIDLPAELEREVDSFLTVVTGPPRARPHKLDSRATR